MKTKGSFTIRTAAVVLLASLTLASLLQIGTERYLRMVMGSDIQRKVQAWVRESAQTGDLTVTPQRIASLQRQGLVIGDITLRDSRGHERILWEDVPMVTSSPPLLITAPVSQGQLRFTVSSWHLDAVYRYRSWVWLALLALSLGSSLAAGSITAFNTRPLRRLIEKGAQLTSGSFDLNFDSPGAAEVQRLAQVFESVRLRFRQLVGGAITQAMVWEGNLELFPLSQLLMMLRFTTQTGVLVIMAGADLGRIYVREGRIRGAAFRDQNGLRAFYALFLLQKGSFKFNPKMRPFEDELQTVSWYAALLYAARRVHSLQFIEQYVPDMRFVAKADDRSHVVEAVVDLTPDEKMLWQIIDGEKNVRQLANYLHWTPERVQRYLYRMAVIGLIESQFAVVSEPPPSNLVSLWARAAWRHRRPSG